MLELIYCYTKKNTPMPYPIIGMSPGNSYFKDEEVAFLLETTVTRFGKAAILIADIPAIATYMAYGYPENRARNKAIPKGNNLKNRSRRIANQLGIDDKVRIIDWEKEVGDNPEYQRYYSAIWSLYESNLSFAKEVDETTLAVLEGSGRDIQNLKEATKVAVHYLLSELAFLEFAPSFLETDQVTYVYHKNWPVYERYVSGVFDGNHKQHLDFLLLENPRETYELREKQSLMERIEEQKTLRCSFTNYPPGFIENQQTGGFSGIFYDLIEEFAKEHDWKISWSEETGYGVIGDGLKNGRFDIFSAPTWPIPERLQELILSRPVYSSDVWIWVREKDQKVASSEDILSNQFFRVAIKEGDISDSIARADFPLWRKVRVPQLTDTEELLQFVANGDADATFTEAFLVEKFNETSETQLAKIGNEPIRKFGNCFVLSEQNVHLKEILDDFIARKISDGTVKKLLDLYAPNHDKQGICIKEETL